jgi:hypothetical protein
LASEIFKSTSLRIWLVAYIAIELIILVSLVRMNGVFFHAGLDFLPSYAGAQLLIDGGRHDLYDTFMQWHRQQPIINQYDAVWPDRMLQPYVAPPLLAILTIPLLLLSPMAAWITWGIFNAGAAVAAVTLLARRMHIEWSIVALVILASFPLFYTVLLGQVEGILLLAMVIFIIELRRGNDVRAALALSVLALKPQLLLAPLLFIAVTSRRKTLVATMIAGAAQLVVCTAAIGVSGMREYVSFGRRLSSPEGIVATNVPGMVNLRSIVVRAFPGWESRAIDLLIVIGSLALLGAAAWLWFRLGDRALASPSIALLMTTTLLTSYHALYHTAVFATLAVVFLIDAAYRNNDREWAQRLVMFSWLTFAFLPLLPFLVVQSSRVPAMISTVGLIVIWGISIRQTAAMLSNRDIRVAQATPDMDSDTIGARVRD